LRPGSVAFRFGTAAAVAALGGGVWVGDPAGADPARANFSAKQVKEVFAANAIDLCRYLVCSGASYPGARAWETNFTDRSTTENITVVVGKDPGTASVFLESIGSEAQYEGATIGRLDNVAIIVARVSSLVHYRVVHYRVALPMPHPVAAALASLAGPNAPPPSARQERLCRALAKHPLGNAPAPTGVTCTGLPGGPDTEYWFSAGIPERGLLRASIIYRVFSSADAARRDWPSILREHLKNLIAMTRRGPVSGVGVPSELSLTTERNGTFFGGNADATVVVGQVIATIAVRSSDKKLHVNGVHALVKHVIHYLSATERGN
jgi:hypothetical protein